MLVLLEFQSVVDRSMALRILAYTALLYQDLMRAGGGSLPPVFPVVLYNGRHPWTAAEDVSDLLARVRDATGGDDMLRERVAEWTRQWKEEGQVELIHRLAARKFDRATADRIKERLEKVGDSHQTVEAGIWILECESADELLSRLERVSVPAPADGDAATL